MFTGLVEKVGTLVQLDRSRGGNATLTIQHAPWDTALVMGESVAVQGACLTVSRIGSGQFGCDVLDETLNRTNLGAASPGSPLNLERALRLGDRLGGHLVSGHVDGLAQVKQFVKERNDWILRLACGNDLLAGMVEKGSITIDGVSLTLTEVASAHCAVRIIPFTKEHTSLGRLKERDAVNIETDLIGKYVYRSHALRHEGRGVDLNTLARAGFL